MPNQPIKSVRRGRPIALVLTTAIGLMIASAPMSVPAITQWQHETMVNSPEYKQQYGFWEVLDLGANKELNTIHAALLPTGKVLLVAGTGNDRETFKKFHDEGKIEVLKTVVFDPTTNTTKPVETPADFFCGGHALLQSGKLLVAGGTSGYELLKGAVEKPAGKMSIHNEDPDSQPRLLKKGAKFTAPSGKQYVSTQEVMIEPATKIEMDGGATVHQSTAKVFVEAVEADVSYVTDQTEQYAIEGTTGTDKQNLYGRGGPMTLDKQDFRGDNQSYEFDPISEQYVKAGDLKESRWYPTLPVMTDGQVLAISGLDNTGTITETTERYNPDTKTWSWGPSQPFPTYPAMFRTDSPDVLFYSGSSAGYGPIDKGRTPGYWNTKDNSFKTVTGMTDPETLETSASVALPPAQGSNDGSQSTRIMVAGGGGVGESERVTNRTAIINLADPNPSFKAGPSLPDAVRYLNMTVTPWDEVFAAGGSSNYRAKENSYSYKAFSINPTTNQITPLANEVVGRSYHSGSLLLPDGRIMTFGNDPLYADKDNSIQGKFEKRIEIYTPPQLFTGSRPVLKQNDPIKATRGQTLAFESDNAATIRTARLIPPSSATHVTNIEQRSVAAIVKTDGSKVTVSLPNDVNVLPNGWYMLFLTNDKGTPSRAVMVHVN